MNSNWIGGLALIVALAVGVGTFVVYDRTSQLQMEIELLKVSGTKIENSDNETQPEISPTSTPQEETPIPDSTTIRIPTGILLPVPSDPSLKPITSLNLTIPEVSRSADGTLALQLKVFTDQAGGYTALNPKEVISIVNFTGDDIQAYEIKGQFNSMPAKSSTSGSLLFQTDPTKNSLILKIKMGEELKFYELDFKNKTYKETVIG